MATNSIDIHKELGSRAYIVFDSRDKEVHFMINLKSRPDTKLTSVIKRARKILQDQLHKEHIWVELWVEHDSIISSELDNGRIEHTVRFTIYDKFDQLYYYRLLLRK